MQPKFYGPMNPVYPCSWTPTRHCPAVYENRCDDGTTRACARYESEDETPWLAELHDVDVIIVERDDKSTE